MEGWTDSHNVCCLLQLTGRRFAERNSTTFAIVACSSTKCRRLHRTGRSQLLTVPARRLLLWIVSTSSAFGSSGSSNYRSPADQWTQPGRDPRTRNEETPCKWPGFPYSSSCGQHHCGLLLFPSYPDHLPRTGWDQAVAAQLGFAGPKATRSRGGEPPPELDPRTQCHWRIRRKLFCLPFTCHCYGAAQPQPSPGLHQHGASL